MFLAGGDNGVKRTDKQCAVFGQAGNHNPSRLINRWPQHYSAPKTRVETEISGPDGGPIPIERKPHQLIISTTGPLPEFPDR